MIIQLDERGRLINKYYFNTDVQKVLSINEEELNKVINTGHSYRGYWFYTFYVDTNDWKDRNTN